LTFAALQETQLLRDTKVLSIRFGGHSDAIDDIAHANCLTTNVSLCTCLCNELELGSASIVEGYPTVRRRMYGDQFKALGCRSVIIYLATWMIDYEQVISSDPSDAGYAGDV
jgi:hypothetical protein